MPRVSIIIPARDAGDYIGPLLKDVERQTFADLEAIVVDDGATDGTRQVVEAAVARDQRFRLLNSGGVGVGAARNIGVDAASGEFLAFVNADDRVSPAYLQRLLDSISATGSDLVSCDVMRLKGYQTSPSFLHQRACGTPAAGTHISRAPHLVWDTTVGNKLWRREMWDRAGLRYAEGSWWSDLYPSIRGHVAARTADVVGDVLYYWRIHTTPETPVTDDRLTDPAARLASFEDLMVAIRSARRMVAEEQPVPPLLRSLDDRILSYDLPIYLPYYADSDQRYKDLVVEGIGGLLSEFRIRPHRFQLGVPLQLIYEAILARDPDRVEELLHPATEVRPSPARRQRTELVLANAAAAGSTGRNRSTPHGPVGNRLARLGRALRLRRLDAPPVRATVEVERIAVAPSRPTTLVVRGAVRLQAGRSPIAGDWTAAVSLESTRRPRGTQWLPGKAGRVATRAVHQVRGPRAQVVGATAALGEPADQDRHPLARSGWRPFTAQVDLAETLHHKDDRQWRLAIRLRCGLMELSRIPKLTPSAAQRLPGGFTVAADTDLVPSVTGGGRLTLRRERVRGRLVQASEVNTGLALSVEFPRTRTARGAASVLWLQTRDGKVREAEVAAGDDLTVLPWPELTDEPVRYELRCRTVRGTARVRAHPRLTTVYLSPPSLGQRLEAVLQPTPQGHVVLETRRPQLDVHRLWPDELPSTVLLGGATGLAQTGQAPLDLVLTCTWSGERHRVPVQTGPGSWQAAIDIAELTKDGGGESRSWSLHAVTGDGDELPLCVPFERRASLPRKEIVGDHRVRLRLGDQAAPVLEVGQEPPLGQWGQLWRLRRRVVGDVAAAPTDVDALLSTAPSSITRTVELPTLLSVVTAPQVARSRTAVGAPSFREKVDERIRRRRYLLGCTDITPVTQPLINKPQRDRIMAMLGFPVPAKLLEQGDLEDVFRVLAEHEEAVVKPVSGAVGRGVHLLRRSGRGWLNLRTETEVSDDELRASFEATLVRGQPVPLWQVEQLVVGDTNESGHPMDFKLYMFQGRHGLTHQVRRLPDQALFKFYDPAWQAADVGRDQDRVDPTLPAPDDPAPMLDLAVRVSQALPVPFIRIDLLVGRDGLYIGEVTPMPGRYHQFSDAWDQRLGLLWEAAESEYGMEFLTAERFQPALEVIREVTGADRLYPD